MRVKTAAVVLLVFLLGCSGNTANPTARKDAAPTADAPEADAGRTEDAATADARRFEDAALADARRLEDAGPADARSFDDAAIADGPSADLRTLDLRGNDAAVADAALVADASLADVPLGDGPSPRDTAGSPEALPDGACAYAGLVLLPGQDLPDPLTKCQMCRCGADGQVTCRASDRGCCRLGADEILAVDEIRYDNGCKASSCRFDEDEGAGMHAEPGCILGCFHAGNWHASGTYFSDASGCRMCHCEEGVVSCADVACPRCEHHGYSYPEGADFVAADGLGTCHCSGGAVTCTEPADPDSCAYFGTAYVPGAEFVAKDGCSRCRCSEGRVRCHSRECAGTEYCDYGGKPIGSRIEPFLGEDGCSRCFCDHGTVDCIADGCRQVCVDRGRTFADGAKVEMEEDGYNQCQCQAGSVVCTDLSVLCVHYDDYWHKYVASTAAECAAIRFDCPAPTTYFANACGCGCEQNPACPRYLICRGDPAVPAQATCPPDEQIAACPYSEVVYQR